MPCDEIWGYFMVCHANGPVNGQELREAVYPKNTIFEFELNVIHSAFVKMLTLHQFHDGVGCPWHPDGYSSVPR